MPKLNTELNVMAYANGFTLWHCLTDATISEISAVDFVEASKDGGFETVKRNDYIIANCSNGNTTFFA